MKGRLHSLRNRILKLFLVIPGLSRYSKKWYKMLGVKGTEYYHLSSNITFVGDYNLLTMAKGSVIREGSLLHLVAPITIGINSALAYQCTLLTGANPNGPLNELKKIYPKVRKPIIIGDNTWVGARVTILPGVTIGNYCVVAAGSVVNKDVPDYTVVGGVPAKVIKKLNPADFE